MEEDKFKKIIQNIGLDEPAGSFTDNVMKMIKSQEELGINPALRSVLKNELLAEPSSEFSDNLMANIQPKANKILEPIITKKARLIILGIFIPVLFLILISSHSNSNPLHNNSYFSRFSLNLSGTTMGIIKISTSILPYLIPLSILLLGDYFFRTRQRQLT
jgi:hypothetical protein